MIRRVFSNLASFKTLTFHSGLNILLAEKTADATDRQTRNGAGKSSLTELVSFVLGAKCDASSLFRRQALVSHRFGMDFDLAGSSVVAARTGSRPSKIEFPRGIDSSSWPVSPDWDDKVGRFVLSNEEWKRALGSLLFGLPSGARGTRSKFAPPFRSLMSYLVRRQSQLAFSAPESNSADQQLWDQQVALSHLLGLDWTIPQQWQAVRKREADLKQLKGFLKEEDGGVLREVIGVRAELFTRLTVAEQKARQMRERLAGFRIIPDYHDLEREAAQLTARISQYADEGEVDRQLVVELEEAVRAEVPPPLQSLEGLYAEVGVVLPSEVIRRFEDVREFHESIIANRKGYLADEIRAAKTRIAGREQHQRELDERRSQIMAVLRSSGALEQYTLMQSELGRLEAETESLRQRLGAAEKLESEKTELEMERLRLLARLRQDHQEQRDALREAVLAFEAASQALYEKPGSLAIYATENGPEFKFPIPSGNSKGISNMQIFCFDLAITRMCARRQTGPGFLVHDSHLFDGVDDRQVAKALEVGARAAEEDGFQYIVTMNSNDLPVELSDAVRREAVLPVALTDATEDGGLFGIRFD